MQSLILWFTTSAPGKALITLLIQILWKYGTAEVTEKLSKERLRDFVEDQLKKHEEIVKWAEGLKADGLTEEEKNEIRRRKIEIEKAIVNHSANRK